MSCFWWGTKTRESLYVPLSSDEHCLDDRDKKIIKFSPKQIRAITCNFATKKFYSERRSISTYKCSLPDGRIVAVKKLIRGIVFETDEQFMAHVDTLCRVHHPNLVPLLGYCCYSEKYQILVFEFGENNTLLHHLHGGGSVLSWETRYKIAIGIARALSYLHNDCNPHIVHRGIRPANILLDNEFDPQVADLGLQLLADSCHTEHVSYLKEDIGYVPLEYHCAGRMTDKSDVYCFGKLLLELLTGCAHIDQEQCNNHLRSLDNKDKDFSAAVDPNLGGIYNQDEVHRMVVAICACVAFEETPNMAEVLCVLDRSPIKSTMRVKV
ncbi:hypothetical protein ACHQM5_014528 [Ranunculus cassubicifolius]